jgi:hypothetical protein
MIDDYVIKFCKNLRPKDFILKNETVIRKKKAKRQYLNDSKTKEFSDNLNNYFENLIDIPRIRFGNRQTIETLINEECLLFAKYLRNEIKDWIPRIPKII